MKSKLFNLKNQIAVVTGATGLLGQEHCKALASAGAKIVVCDLDIEKCRKTASKITTDTLAFGVDITSKESVIKLRDKTIKEFGRIDVLVNNAGINDMVENPHEDIEMTKFENYPLELFTKVLQVNVTGMFICCQILGTEMLKRKAGSIINISSTYGIVAPDQSLYIKPDGSRALYKSPAYPVSKGAVLMLTRYLASYWGTKGIRVNSLSPGGVENKQDDYFISNYSKRAPIGRMSQKDEYHGALIFLASDASSYMTGANLVVDGGWTIL